MSEGATAGIDPRYDPRFQRGYSGDETAVPRVAPPRATTDASKRSDPETYARFAPPQAPTPPAVAANRTLASGQPRADAPHVHEHEAAGAVADDAAAVRSDDTIVEWLSEAEPVEQRPADPFFLAAWAATALAIVVAIGVMWASISNQSYYGGPVTEADEWLQAASWLIAPALLQGGLAGLVAMLVWTGARHASSSAARESGAR